MSETKKWSNNYIRAIVKALNLLRINLVKKDDDELIEEICEHHGIMLDSQQETIVKDILGI